MPRDVGAAVGVDKVVVVVVVADYVLYAFGVVVGVVVIAANADAIRSVNASENV